MESFWINSGDHISIEFVGGSSIVCDGFSFLQQYINLKSILKAQFLNFPCSGKRNNLALEKNYFQKLVFYYVVIFT